MYFSVEKTLKWFFTVHSQTMAAAAAAATAAIWLCHMALPYGAAMWLCHMTLPFDEKHPDIVKWAPES